MGDVGDTFKDYKKSKNAEKRLYGMDCPWCVEHYPKRIPTRLMPGQKCRWCGYKRPMENPQVTPQGWKCIWCSASVQEYMPVFCCLGDDCGCQGLPIEPPVCETCAKERMGEK